MISIVTAHKEDFKLLADIGARSFIESHGSSASADVIHTYVKEKFNDEECTKELTDSKNTYHFIYQNQQPAGYSKIIFNAPHSNISLQNVTKLERLYLLKAFYHLQLGFKLFQFNLELSKQNGQAGMWLFVWTENKRAIDFYRKNGFAIIGDSDFHLTETHSNPNYQMFLAY